MAGKGENTRERILATARSAFAELGYGQASVRRIAAAAGVDQSLVHHYFGTKKALYLEATRIPLDPRALLSETASLPDEELGADIIAMILKLMDSPAGQAHRAVIVSMLVPHRDIGALRDYLTEFVLKGVAARLGGDAREARLRAAVIATQVSGLIMARYIVGIKEISALDDEEVIAIYGPILQHLINMPLQGARSRRKSCLGGPGHKSDGVGGEQHAGEGFPLVT